MRERGRERTRKGADFLRESSGGGGDAGAVVVYLLITRTCIERERGRGEMFFFFFEFLSLGRGREKGRGICLLWEGGTWETAFSFAFLVDLLKCQKGALLIINYLFIFGRRRWALPLFTLLLLEEGGI